MGIEGGKEDGGTGEEDDGDTGSGGGRGLVTPNGAIVISGEEVLRPYHAWLQIRN